METATYSKILAWEIPWTGQPGRSMQLQRVGHNLATKTIKPLCECVCAHRSQIKILFILSTLFYEDLQTGH